MMSWRAPATTLWKNEGKTKDGPPKPAGDPPPATASIPSQVTMHAHVCEVWVKQKCSSKLSFPKKC